MDDAPDVVGRDDVADRDLAGVEVDLDRRDARRPAERRVGVAAVRRVVERRRPGTARTARRRECGRGARRPRGTTSANGRPPLRSSTSARSRRAAWISSPPTTIAVRLRDRRAGVGHDRGVLRRDLDVVVRRRPSSAATSCGKIVFVPWPISVEPVRTRIGAVAAQLDRRDRRELDLARAGEPGAVPGERDPDARRDPVPPGPERRRRQRPGARPARTVARRPRPDALELGRLGGSLEHLRRGHALAEDLAGRRRVALAVQVPAADLERAHAQRLGEAVDLHLGRELGLRRAEAAERAVGRRVRRASRGPGSGRSRSDTGRRRGARRATGRPASACSTRRRP